MKSEKQFQASLIKELKEKFPGCIILKNDPTYKQGIPDLTFLWQSFWAALECKKDAKASRGPNQEYYVRKMDEMSFSAFVHPGNKDEIIEKMVKKFHGVNSREKHGL